MRFDILQIEVTSRCNAGCRMCPKSYLKEWKSGDMGMDLFLNMSDIFPSVNYIHLQGWGEPLLHPKFDDMISIIKKKGRRCGFTTNGQLLSAEKVKFFIDLNVDLIAVSMAGADKRMHEYIRRGTEFDKIIKNLLYIANEKERRSLKKPELVLLFIMTYQNIEQLPAFVELASEVGAVRVVPNNIDFIPCRQIDELRAFNREEKKEIYENIIAETKQKAKEKNLQLRLYPLFPEEQGICEADPLRNLYVSFDGCVSPCVYLGLPVDSISIYRDGKIRRIARLCFGNIRNESIADIWKKKEYRNFRSIMKKRKLLSLINIAVSSFGFGIKPYRLPFPEECKGCYKLYGF